VLSALALSVPGLAGRTNLVVDFVAEGDRHFRVALFDPAERAFRSALAQDAQSGPAHLGLARTLAASRHLDVARGEAELAVQLAPLPQGQLTLAALREESGDLSGSVAALREYLAGARGEPPVRIQRARAQMELLEIAGSAPLRRVGGSPVVTLAIDLVQDKVLFKASVNGRVPIDMVLDTGADQFVVSNKTAERAGLRRTAGGAGRGAQMGLIETLDIAGISVRRVPAIIRHEPLIVLANRAGEAFSPLPLGLSMIVDYGRRELTLGQRLPFEPADVELPLHIAGLPVIAGSHAGRAVSFVIDTGADVSSVSSATFAEARLGPSSRQIPMRLFDALGKRQPDAFLVTPGLDLAFGAIQLPGYPVVVRTWPDVEAAYGFEMGGILGHNFLRAYRVTIDLNRRVVRFKRS